MNALVIGIIIAIGLLTAIRFVVIYTEEEPQIIIIKDYVENTPIQLSEKTWLEIRGKGQCYVDPWITHWLKSHNNYPIKSDEQFEAIKNYYREELGVSVFDVRVQPSDDFIEVCGAGGATYSVLVSNSDVDKMLDLGFKISENQIQSVQKTWVETYPVDCVNYTNPKLLQGCYIGWLKDYYDSEPNQPMFMHNDPQFSFEANSEYIKDYFGKQGSQILDVRYAIVRQEFCEFGECFDHYKLSILVSDSNVNKMLDLGFKVSENQAPE